MYCQPVLYRLLRLVYRHRRRIKIEEKAKVVASAWGTDLFKSLPCYSCFALDDLKNMMNCTRMIRKKRMNSSYSLKLSYGK